MSYKRLINQAEHLMTSPISIRNETMRTLEDALGGELDIVDPTNPWVFLMESLAANTAGALQATESLTRMQHRGRAQTQEELFYHMSDRDHLDRFSKPTRANVNLMLNRQQVLDNAVLDVATGNKKLIIPKDTRWDVAGYSFYQHFPLVIEITPGEDFITYLDTSVETPVRKIDNNIVPNTTMMYQDSHVLLLKIPTDELLVESHTNPITKSTGFNVTIPFERKFYYLRAFYTTDNVNWTEMLTTHTREAYDPAKPTMVLEANETSVRCRIPDIYLENNMVGTNCRVEIYSTNGDVQDDLANYVTEQWGASWFNYSNRDVAYAEPLTGIETLAIWSSDKLSGGHNGIGFDQLRENVFYGIDDERSASTFREFKNQMSKRGYNVTVQKDNVFERTYVANSQLASPQDAGLSSSPGVTAYNVFIDNKRLDVPNAMVVNGERLTIKSNSFFKEGNGGIQLAPDSLKADLDALSIYDRVDRLNSEQLFYTPFYYVLDTGSSFFKGNAYHLDSPYVQGTIYQRTNDVLGIKCRTTKSTLVQTDGDWKLTVNTEHTKNLTDAVLAMVFTAKDGSKRYLTSDQVIESATNSTFEFTLETDYDINANHEIVVKNMFDVNHVVTPVNMNIESEVELVYIAKGTVVSSVFDNIVPTGAVTGDHSTISLEKSTIILGLHMNGLYTHSRALLSPAEYERYAVDVPETYPSTEYLTDANGIVFNLDDDGKPTPVIKHNKGDVVMKDGEPAILHKKGDIIFENGVAKVKSPEYVSREMRLFLVEAKYYYASTDVYNAYRKDLPGFVQSRLGDIVSYRPEVRERTGLFYEPTSTVISSLVRINSLRQTRMNTAVKFKVEVTLRSEDYDDGELRVIIANSVRRVLGNAMSKSTYSYSDLIDELNSVGGSAVVNINFESSMPGDTVTIMDDNTSFSVRSRIVPVTSGQLTIEDDIDFDWIKN